MRKSILTVLIISMVATMLFTSCQSENTQADSEGVDSGKKFNIVTSFYPMYLLTKNIAKGINGVSVENMTEPQTGCLHDYQFSPSDLKILEDADVFIINGAGMESFMEKVINQLPKLKVIEASKGIELIKNPGDDEENPHVWVSPANAIKQVRNIGKELAVINPENGDAYKTNTEVYESKIESLRYKMHKTLEGARNRDIVTFHEAFPYFAKEFNLNIVSVVEREPGSEPSAGELADTIKMIKSKNVKTLFAEPQYSSKAADTIANETGAKIYTLDPIVTGPKNGDPDSYIKTMEENLKSLEKALITNGT